MAKKTIFELESDEDVKQWHDAAYAEYEEALEAFTKATSSKQPSSLIDKKIKKRYEDARDNLRAGVQYWREVGEACGARTGILIEDNTIEGDE